MYWVACTLMLSHTSSWRYLVMLIIVWLAAIILTIPLFHLSAVDDDGEGRFLCAIIWTTDSKEVCLKLLQNYTDDPDYNYVCPMENPNISHCSFCCKISFILLVAVFRVTCGVACASDFCGALEHFCGSVCAMRICANAYTSVDFFEIFLNKKRLKHH